MMHPGLQGLLGGGLASVVLELRRTRDDGVAPALTTCQVWPGGSEIVSALEIGMPVESEQRRLRCPRAVPSAQKQLERKSRPALFRTPRRDKRSATTSSNVLGPAVRRTANGHGSISLEARTMTRRALSLDGRRP